MAKSRELGTLEQGGGRCIQVPSGQRFIFGVGTVVTFLEAMIKRVFPEVKWDPSQFVAPWEEEGSVYESIKSFLETHERVDSLEDHCVLPDDEAQDSESLKWVAGGIDGSMGHHGSYGEDIVTARRIARCLARVLHGPTKQRLSDLYALFEDRKALSYVDPLLECLIDDRQFHNTRLHDLAHFFATRSPHREVVKTFVAVMGLFSRESDVDLFMVLGKHEEFTLYASIAISNSAREPDDSLWELAKCVDGWGRVQAVERMAGTDNFRIRQWMVREGYRNSINYEYLAFTCATTGDLHADLRRPEVDAELLVGAGDILDALIRARTGASMNIFDYEDGAESVEHYLRHVKESKTTLEEELIAHTLLEFLKAEDINWQLEADRGWTSYRRFHLIKEADAFVSEEGWNRKIVFGLKSMDEMEFGTAVLAAKYLDIDTWPEFFLRLKNGGAYWSQVMQTNDTDRISKVVELARDTFPLEDIGSGPALELGVGKKFREHRYLDSIIYELGRFPGVGICLIKAGLSSPVVRNRVTALRALACWGREWWTKEVIELIQYAQRREPDKELKSQLSRVLRGQPLNGM